MQGKIFSLPGKRREEDRGARAKKENYSGVTGVGLAPVSPLPPELPPAEEPEPFPDGALPPRGWRPAAADAPEAEPAG